MAAKATRVNVTNAPTLLVGTNVQATIKNRDAAASIFLGGANVDAATGYELKPNEVFSVSSSIDPIYAIAAAAGPFVVQVLTTRERDR